MKELFIVYNHYTVLRETLVKADSHVEAQQIVEQQMKRRGNFESIVDKVISAKEEQRLNANRDFHGGPGYGA